MACGSCGGGGNFTPATYTAVTDDGASEQTFLSKTQAIMHVSRAGGGEIRTNPGAARGVEAQG